MQPINHDSKATPTALVSNKHEHDIRNALQTLQLAINNLRSGYRFDDARAPHKIAAMDKAVATLQQVLFLQDSDQNS